MYSVCIQIIRFRCSGRVTDGFPQKKLDRGVGGWVELYPIFFLIFRIFLTYTTFFNFLIFNHHFLNSHLDPSPPSIRVFFKCSARCHSSF